VNSLRTTCISAGCRLARDGIVAAVLYFPIAAGGQQRRPSAAQKDGTPSAVREIGTPRWWVVPNHEGNIREGKLFFGVELENVSSKPQFVALSFQSYTADGTKYEGCYGIGGGPGVSDEIAPGSRALISCHRAIVPVSRQRLDVTARVWSIRPVVFTSSTASVIEADLLAMSSDGTYQAFNASFRIKAPHGKDVRLVAFDRFYSEDGIQVATCSSRTLIIEPEIAQRATCPADVLVDVMSPRPKRVSVELRGR